MKKEYGFCVVFALLLTSCGSPNTGSQNKIMKNTEDAVIEGLEQTAASAYQCREQRVALIKDNETTVRDLIALFKTAAKKPGKAPEIDLKTLGEHYYARPTDADLGDDIYGILTSEGFKLVLKETAEFLEQISNNDAVIENLIALRDQLGKKPGDKLAEIITLLATDRSKQEILFGIVKTANCESASNQNIVDALMSPFLLLQLGKPGLYLLKNDFKKHIKSLVKIFEETIILPNSLKEFAGLVQGIVPKQNICEMENLNSFQNFAKLAAILLKAPEDQTQHRPLRVLLNTVMRLYTMSDDNQCLGISYDNLQTNNIKEALLLIAGLIKSPLEWN